MSCESRAPGHAKGVLAALEHGIEIVMSKGCAEKIGVFGRNGVKIIKHGEKVKIGRFTVMAFDVNHDSPETLGFLIHHPETGITCFLTDSYFSTYVFENVRNFVVEANYSESILQNNLDSKKIHPVQYSRVKRSHMSIDNCINFIKAHDLKKIKTVTLIHLSAQNSDSDDFKMRVVKELGKRCQIARKGLIVNLSNEF